MTTERWTVHIQTVDGANFEHKHEFPSLEVAEVFVKEYIRLEPPWLKELRIYAPDHAGEDDYAKRLLFKEGKQIHEPLN